MTTPDPERNLADFLAELTPVVLVCPDHFDLGFRVDSGYATYELAQKEVRDLAEIVDGYRSASLPFDVCGGCGPLPVDALVDFHWNDRRETNAREYEPVPDQYVDTDQDEMPPYDFYVARKPITGDVVVMIDLPDGSAFAFPTPVQHRRLLASLVEAIARFEVEVDRDQR